MAQIVMHPSNPPVGMTTSATLAKDLGESLQVGQLEDAILTLRIADGRNARYLAVLAVRLQDRACFDAAVWRAAEHLRLLEFGRDDRLITLSPAIRSRYLTQAHRAVTAFMATLEGLISPLDVQQSYADFASHRLQIANARSEQAASNAGGRS